MINTEFQRKESGGKKNKKRYIKGGEGMKRKGVDKRRERRKMTKKER